MTHSDMSVGSRACADASLMNLKATATADVFPELV